MYPYSFLCIFMALFRVLFRSNATVWVLIDPDRCLCVLMGPYMFLELFMRPYVSSWVLVVLYAFFCVFMVPKRSLYVLMGF